LKRKEFDMCYEYERLEQLRKEMEREMEKGRELKKQSRTAAPTKPAPEKGADAEERQPVPA
jgi:hypothetical protein